MLKQLFHFNATNFKIKIIWLYPDKNIQNK